MSGYLDVKYPCRSNPFKSWKRQWCILRPSPTSSGGCLAVYYSEAGAAAGCVELPFGCVVKRTKSRSRPYAFAIFSAEEPCKPRVLLASQTYHDAEIWMEKIRSLINGSKYIGAEASLKDTYSVSVVGTELARRCGLGGLEGTATVCPAGLLVARADKPGVFLQWRHVLSVLLADGDSGTNACVVCVDSNFTYGSGKLKFTSPLAADLVRALKRATGKCSSTPLYQKFSKSEGDLRNGKFGKGETRRSSWYSGPSEVSLDDMELVLLKDTKRIPSGQLSRCTGAGDLTPNSVSASNSTSAPNFTSAPNSDSAQNSISALGINSTSAPNTTSTLVQQSGESQPEVTHCCSSNVSDRRSLASVASGIYEEIPDLPEAPADSQYCMMTRDMHLVKNFKMEAMLRLEEPTYESIAECVYATFRRTARRHPPPLPPRLPYGPCKLDEPWGGGPQACRCGVTRHASLCSLCSLGSLARCGRDVAAADKPRTLPRWDKSRHAFSVFRKRLKSDSRVASSPKTEPSKENKDVETKKKKFDFTPTRDIFKNFRVGRKMKNLKITGLGKGETKSCEFLDETEHVQTDRCSKSVESLDPNDEFSNGFSTQALCGADLSIEFDGDSVAALSLSQEIVKFLLDSDGMREVPRTGDESGYMPMSPIVPSNDHYIVMSPRTNTA